MNSSYLSKEQVIFKTTNIDDKIYIREQNGVFQRLRRTLNLVLMLLFICIPLLRYNGSQAVCFDIAQQKLQLFFITLFPQDLFIFSLVFILAAFGLFYLTKLYGRIWCGFTCPQTVWLLMFNWVERRVEGSHNQSKLLDSRSWSTNKLIRKGVKHLIWLAISLVTALVFISYFVPIEQLYLPFFTFQASSLTVYWVLFFAGCTYINASWIKEKMCQHICPYSRFQSAMFDQTTKLVSYDQLRGENRGKRKRKAAKAQTMGDCVDCKLCVQVCPAGIDIRDGLQYECINCALCIDACDMTMEKFNYPKGLIAFSSQKQTKNRWRRHLGYSSIIMTTLLLMLLWVQSWQSFEVNIIRDRQALYRINLNGDVENSYLIKIRNKSQQSKTYRITIEGLKNASLFGSSQITVAAGELTALPLAVAVEHNLTQVHNELTFNIIDTEDGTSIFKTTSFYSGEGGW